MERTPHHVSTSEARTFTSLFQKELLLFQYLRKAVNMSNRFPKNLQVKPHTLYYKNMV